MTKACITLKDLSKKRFNLNVATSRSRFLSCNVSEDDDIIDSFYTIYQSAKLHNAVTFIL